MQRDRRRHLLDVLCSQLAARASVANARALVNRHDRNKLNGSRCRPSKHMEYLKLGVDGVRGRWSSAVVSVDSLAVPVFTSDKLPSSK